MKMYCVIKNDGEDDIIYGKNKTDALKKNNIKRSEVFHFSEITVIVVNLDSEPDYSGLSGLELAQAKYNDIYREHNE